VEQNILLSDSQHCPGSQLHLASRGRIRTRYSCRSSPSDSKGNTIWPKTTHQYGKCLKWTSSNTYQCIFQVGLTLASPRSSWIPFTVRYQALDVLFRLPSPPGYKRSRAIKGCPPARQLKSPNKTAQPIIRFRMCWQGVPVSGHVQHTMLICFVKLGNKRQRLVRREHHQFRTA